MNYQEIYRDFVRERFVDESHNIIRAILYIHRNFYKTPRSFQRADRELDDDIKNEIILGILKDDELASKYKLCRI